MKILETQRLLLREFETHDAESLYLLNSDPDVIKYTGDPPFANVFEARSFIENYNQYKLYGFGRWAVIDKSTSLFMGWCGLKYGPSTDETDIGFRFFKRCWNKGYATESAQACLEFGFGKLDRPSIIGRAMKENTASIRVLEKLGMAFESEFDFYRGHAGALYRMNKENFKML